MINNITKNALLIVLYLAETKVKKSKREICDATGANPNYFSETMKILVNAKVVESSQGQNGGYIFVGNLKELTFYDVYFLCQTPLEIDKCLIGGAVCTAENMAECFCKQMIVKAVGAMCDGMKNITLEKLLEMKQLAIIKKHNGDFKI